MPVVGVTQNKNSDGYTGHFELYMKSKSHREAGIAVKHPMLSLIHI